MYSLFQKTSLLVLTNRHSRQKEIKKVKGLYHGLLVLVNDCGALACQQTSQSWVVFPLQQLIDYLDQTYEEIVYFKDAELVCRPIFNGTKTPQFFIPEGSKEVRKERIIQLLEQFLQELTASTEIMLSTFKK